MTTSIPADIAANYPGGSVQTVLTRFTRNGQRYTSTDAVWSRLAADPTGGFTVFTVGFCQARPELFEFTVGGTVFVDDDGNPVGWGEPSTPVTDPIDVEVYTARVREGVVVGYYHWTATCEGLRYDSATFDGEHGTDFLVSGAVTPGTISYRLDSTLPSPSNDVEDI